MDIYRIIIGVIYLIHHFVESRKKNEKNEIGDWTKNHIEKYNGDLN